MSTPTPPPSAHPLPPAGGMAPEHGSYSFFDAIKQGFSKYVTFSGRARRSEYWYWTLFCFIVSLAVGGVGGVAEGLSSSASNSPFANWVSNLVNIVLVLPSLAVAVRRLHDTNRSGWWLLLPVSLTLVSIALYFMAFGAAIFNLGLSDGTSLGKGALGLAIAGAVVGLGAFATWILQVVWSASDGGPNVPNKYGVRE